MTRKIVLLAVVTVLSGCGGPRFAGLNNCSADGSVVLLEYPNSAGSYAGLNNAPCRPKS